MIHIRRWVHDATCGQMMLWWCFDGIHVFDFIYLHLHVLTESSDSHVSDTAQVVVANIFQKCHPSTWGKWSNLTIYILFSNGLVQPQTSWRCNVYWTWWFSSYIVMLVFRSVPSLKLAYYTPSHFWRWFSFSRLVGYVSFRRVLRYVICGFSATPSRPSFWRRAKPLRPSWVCRLGTWNSRKDSVGKNGGVWYTYKVGPVISGVVGPLEVRL